MLKRTIMVLLILTSSLILFSEIIQSKENPQYYVIKVHVYDRNENPVDGALVRATGNNFDECGITVSGVCAFYPNNTGTYNICASKDNMYNSTSVVVSSGTFIYDVYITIELSGTCTDCDESKK